MITGPWWYRLPRPQPGTTTRTPADMVAPSDPKPHSYNTCRRLNGCMPDPDDNDRCIYCGRKQTETK